MEREAREAPERIEQQLVSNKALIKAVGNKIRAFNPEYVVTVGRGTSDHAGVFAKYLIEVELGLPVSSAAPSVASVYGRQMKLDKALVLFISQSGRSPDILAQAEMAKKAGAFCVALVNDETAPVGDIADAVIPLKAGQEKAVAATKSYLATLSALLQLVASWSENEDMLSDLNKLPGLLAEMVNSPAQLLPADFQNMANCVVLGRGFGYAISLEIALKLKEVCAIHAEAFSSAEFFHGPVTLVGKDFTIVDMQVEDESAPYHRESMKEIKQRGACILPMALNRVDIHPRMAPLLLLQRFYLDVERIAVALGGNPDSPPGLCKVTRTV
jgi:glucosamine--fructose-6-phosphate aminotransferase (isomerizing)